MQMNVIGVANVSRTNTESKFGTATLKIKIGSWDYNRIGNFTDTSDTAVVYQMYP